MFEVEILELLQATSARADAAQESIKALHDSVISLAKSRVELTQELLRLSSMNSVLERVLASLIAADPALERTAFAAIDFLSLSTVSADTAMQLWIPAMQDAALHLKGVIEDIKEAS